MAARHWISVDGVCDFADPLDLHLAGVARLEEARRLMEEAHARRCACKDDVARQQFEEPVWGAISGRVNTAWVSLRSARCGALKGAHSAIHIDTDGSHAPGDE